MALWSTSSPWPHPQLVTMGIYTITVGGDVDGPTFTCPGDPPEFPQLAAISPPSHDLTLFLYLATAVSGTDPSLPLALGDIPDGLLATVRITGGHIGLFPARVCVDGHATDGPGPFVGEIAVDYTGAAVYPPRGPDDPSGLHYPATPAGDYSIDLWYAPPSPHVTGASPSEQDVIFWVTGDLPSSLTLPWSSTFGRANVGATATVTIYAKRPIQVGEISAEVGDPIVTGSVGSISAQVGRSGYFRRRRRPPGVR